MPVQVQMYAHPKRHSPQTEQQTKTEQTNMHRHTHPSNLSITCGNGMRWTRNGTGDE